MGRPSVAIDMTFLTDERRGDIVVIKPNAEVRIQCFPTLRLAPWIWSAFSQCQSLCKEATSQTNGLAEGVDSEHFSAWNQILGTDHGISGSQLSMLVATNGNTRTPSLTATYGLPPFLVVGIRIIPQFADLPPNHTNIDIFSAHIVLPIG